MTPIPHLGTTTDPHDVLPLIRIVAAVVLDWDGRMLVVRKRGTRAFMQPGGKREPGEADLAALARELHEELGCATDAVRAEAMGTFRAMAAHEPGHQVEAALYALELVGPIAPAAEIEEIAWVDPSDPGDLVLAPLTEQAALPLALGLRRPSLLGTTPGKAP